MSNDNAETYNDNAATRDTSNSNKSPSRSEDAKDIVLNERRWLVYDDKFHRTKCNEMFDFEASDSDEEEYDGSILGNCTSEMEEK